MSRKKILPNTSTDRKREREKERKERKREEVFGISCDINYKFKVTNNFDVFGKQQLQHEIILPPFPVAKTIFLNVSLIFFFLGKFTFLHNISETCPILLAKLL